MDTLIKDYTDWLRNETDVLPADDDWTQLVTPFLNFNNDNIEIYFRPNPDGTIVYSDGKQTLRELEMAGLSRLAGKRKIEVDKILRAYGIQLIDEELIVTAPANKKESTLHRLLEATKEILDMRVLAQSKTKSFFLEDLQDLFMVRNIPFLRNPSFFGKSGLANTFDFAIPNMGKQPEKLIRGVGQPRQDRVMSAIMLIMDTLATRPGSQGMVILNDLNGYSADLEQALTSYQMPFGKMSDQDAIIRQLKVAA